MPHRKRPITQRPKVEDESIGNPPERHGPHQPYDEALPGKGGRLGGLNRQASPPGRKQNLGRPKGR
ncbi:MAG TPA: hypothetical protein VFQ38_10155 [Longimicrobiales bacterium]|nr:hypothetical protein [Longimicrobiales bacterium]